MTEYYKFYYEEKLLKCTYKENEVQNCVTKIENTKMCMYMTI